ncbi:hypothetical protein PIB30_044061 [Stylosanthes scabra]|uniref:Putative plant transposon protein domain-containing protein n=1 Tax=Stylosanthes scabra TaxID=79078 RepID=A0ABU6UHK6_9FABA|nr:hypothetical protein [Stylosanthes scabra]
MASSSSYINDDHYFRSQFHQDLFQQYIHKKGVTPEKHFELQEGNKSEIIVARAVLIHSIIKGHDVRVEELIVDNIAIIAESAQGRSKLSFPSTIFRLCKEAGISMA